MKLGTILCVWNKTFKRVKVGNDRVGNGKVGKKNL